jgi:nucleoside-diphosphate-sugar epimerase
MQTILGSGGVIGRELSRHLPRHAERIRQVSREPVRVHRTDEVVPADLLDPADAARAVRGSDVAYLTVGLEYSTDVWERDWPKIIENAIRACGEAGVRLVFLDNVYAYGRVDGSMTEETPFNPCSRKGEVRARVATRLLEAMKSGEVQGMIVRSADFYGPAAEQSFTHIAVFERMGAGKSPRWLGNPKSVHTFTFTIDVARTLALLGNTLEAYGETWHAATSREAMSGAGFVQLASEVAMQPYALEVPPGWLLKVMARFNPLLAENLEMMYQFDENYLFDSSKLLEVHGLEATPYRRGLQATIHRMDERDLRAELEPSVRGSGGEGT